MSNPLLRYSFTAILPLPNRKKERTRERERDFSNRIERFSNRGEKKNPRICSENGTAVTFELPFICTVKPDPVPPLLQAGRVGVEKAADKGPDAGVRNNWNVGDVWFISRGFSSHFTQSPRGSGAGGAEAPPRSGFTRRQEREGDRRGRSRDTTWETSKVTGISDWTGRLALYRNALIRLAPQFSRVSFFFQCARPTTTTPPESSRGLQDLLLPRTSISDRIWISLKRRGPIGLFPTMTRKWESFTTYGEI